MTSIVQVLNTYFVAQQYLTVAGRARCRQQEFLVAMGAQDGHMASLAAAVTEGGLNSLRCVIPN